MQRVVHQDRDAFAELLSRHIDALHRYAVRLSHSTSLADDLVQDTWLNVWQKARQYDPKKASLSTWLHRLLHNRFIDWQRKQKPQVNDEVLQQISDPSSTPEQLYDSEQGWQGLQRELAELPDNQRAAVILTHLQGLSTKEMAQVLGLSPRAAESSLARARRTLRESLQAKASNS